MQLGPVTVTATIYFHDGESKKIDFEVSPDLEHRESHLNDAIRKKVLASKETSERLAQLLSQVHYVRQEKTSDSEESLVAYPASSILRVEARCDVIEWIIPER